MYKRMSIRIVDGLSAELKEIAKKRGLSVNSLISEMAWDFVDDWKKEYGDFNNKQIKKTSNMEHKEKCKKEE